MTIGLSLLFELGMLSMFILQFWNLPVSCMLFVNCHLYSHLIMDFLSFGCTSIVLQLVLRHLGFLWLACLAELSHFLALEKICTTFVYILINYYTTNAKLSNYCFLYVFRTMLSFFVVTNCSFVALENNILKIWIDIIFPSLPMSLLYRIIALFWLDVFNFATFTDHLWTPIKEIH